MKHNSFYTVKTPVEDISLKTKNFSSGSALASLTAGQFVYIGYYKKFSTVYVDFAVKNEEAVQLTYEYFNGVDWVELPNLVDETENFINSGFFYFDRAGDWVESEIGGEKQFYIRIGTDLDLTATTEFNGVGVLLSNDVDLIGIRSNIVSKHNNGKTWVQKHENARKHIIQQLRNLGYYKVKRNENNPLYYSTGESLFFSNLTEFDLLEPFELREAAKYYAMSMIYLDELTDENDDKWSRQGIRYGKMADGALNLFMMKFDSNDDGEEDSQENEGETRTNLTWV